MSIAELIQSARQASGLPEKPAEPEFQNISQAVSDAMRKYADKPAFTSIGRTVSFRELDHYSGAFASFLQNELGLEPGTRVAIQMPNLVQYPVAVFGTIRAGMTVVNTNPLYTEREMIHQFNDSGAEVLVVLANFLDLVAKALPETGIKHVVITELADLHPPLKRLIINLGARYIKKIVPPVKIAGAIPFTRALSRGAARPYTEADRGPDDVAVLQYTGGTTGVSKGAMLSHGNLLWNAEQTRTLVDIDENYVEGEDVMILPLPMYHIYAFTMSLLMMAGGNHTVLIPNPRDLEALIGEMERWQMTSFAGINTLFVALCNNERFRKLDFSKLRTTVSGGMALTLDAARQWQEVTGAEISEGYGLTETSPTVSANPKNAAQIGTIGVAVPGTEIRLINDQGEEVGPNEPGELCVRGPQVMLGYWQRPEATAEVITEDGWLSTGDIAVVTDDGYLKIVDRKKDMVVVSGFNVYPNEIEDVVVQHPGVLECAVIGVPDQKSGEAPKLFVVKQDPALTREQVEAFCREQLTGYKIPRHIEFRDELPKSNVGKILRRELRDQA